MGLRRQGIDFNNTVVPGRALARIRNLDLPDLQLNI
jgi:hypothetical protein